MNEEIDETFYIYLSGCWTGLEIWFLYIVITRGILDFRAFLIPLIPIPFILYWDYRANMQLRQSNKQAELIKRNI